MARSISCKPQWRRKTVSKDTQEMSQSRSTALPRHSEKKTWHITKARLFKYIENFTSKRLKNVLIKTPRYFSYVCSKDRLWVLTSTHNLCFFRRNKTNNVYPCIPQFYYIKVGFKGSKLYRYVFVMNKQRKNKRQKWNRRRMNEKTVTENKHCGGRFVTTICNMVTYWQH